MMASIVEEFFGQAAAPTGPPTDAFFDRYGLEQNPFPPNRMIIPEVLFDQEISFERFKVAVREILGKEPERRAMAVVAGTGGGKTHFLRHCQFKFERLCDELGRNFAVVEFSAGSGKVMDLIREIFRACDKCCRTRFETDWVTAILRKIQSHERRAQLIDSIAVDELRHAISVVSGSLEPGYKPPDKAGQFGFEALHDVFRRWLFGESLTQTERKYLPVTRIPTASMAVRILREVFVLARSLDVVAGALICLDEIEALFTKGWRLAQVQAFLQDIRYLFDETVRDRRGFSLLFLSASTTTGADKLREVSYPVYQRLTYEGQSRTELVQIRGVVEAIDFANEYVDYFHQKWQQKNEGRQPSKAPQSLLSQKEIEEAFREVSGASGWIGQAPQGPLLDVFHQKVEEKRTGKH